MAKETVSSIVAWCEQTFPDATMEGQLVKYYDEFKELISAGCKDLTEIVDMFIVGCSVRRFDLSAGDVLCLLATRAVVGAGFSSAEFQKALDEKMAINRARDWNFKDGKYQHKEAK